MLKTYLAAQTQLENAKVRFQDHMGDLKRRFKEDQDGAALIEYSILIGLITVAAITAIIAVGAWVSKQWTSLQGKLP